MGMFGNGAANGMTATFREVVTPILPILIPIPIRTTCGRCAGVAGLKTLTLADPRLGALPHQTFRAIVVASGWPQFASDLSFLLMSANEKSDRPAFFVALFAETKSKELIKELAALYKVSLETMARLKSLYEKIRDFTLDK
jgi:hypothetical protein